MLYSLGSTVISLEHFVCEPAAASTAVSINALNLALGAICTINVGTGVFLDPLPIPATTNGAVAVSLINPIVAAHAIPFVGSFDVTYSASPLPGCPGEPKQSWLHSARYYSCKRGFWIRAQG